VYITTAELCAEALHTVGLLLLLGKEYKLEIVSVESITAA
jgi:hypothetical protein